MPVDVIMPQMGESIFEGTITKWLKKTGDAVQKDEPLFEISTDKVDAEIPSPVTGILQDIKIPEGETVQVNTVVAIVSEESASAKPKTPVAKETRPSAAGPSAPKPAPAPSGPPKTPAAPEVSEGTSGQVDVIMPQMGESIFEGTITKWLKKAGDTVQKDEPLFEISTDKVDAEIPSPISGVLAELKVPEGETVEVNTVVAVIAPSGSRARAIAQPDGTPVSSAPPVVSQARVAAPPSPAAMPGPGGEAIGTPDQVSADPQEVRSSPLVRRIAREHQLDLRRVSGSGSNGRITKEDVVRYLQNGGAARVPTADRLPSAPSAVTPAAIVSPSATRATPPATPAPELIGKLEPMSRMRTIIAQRMVESRHTIPHAYSIYKVDMTRVVRMREQSRAAFEQQSGVKLTFMPFLAAAAVDALRRFPVVNASIEGNAIRYHDHIHLGIAVALEWGLIVPVIREAERRSFRDLAVAIADLAERARTKKLKPEEASGSTFTLTNPGVFGGEYGTPIINQPEAAILAIGGLKKEPVVLTDAEGNDTIAIRSMQQHCLGFDHRIIDGADAGRFMTAFKDALEQWSTPVL
ncbi:2-oxoglutarate dehydrogenase, E2 component, dihydrolipoamide succinyltransferase [Acidobacteria bacterium AB60]|nr:2-oxoglutarate dehydrogenase, E2 component, dihydrolipoamide succinyltransferase [Acidobacteria bacterium AB60]